MERQLRLREDAAIRTVRSRGRAVADGPYVIRYVRNVSDSPANRYAVIAGRRSGGAVQRNRLKRVTREALRRLHPSLRAGYDVVVIIRGTVEELSGAREAEERLARMFAKAGMRSSSTVPSPGAV